MNEKDRLDTQDTLLAELLLRISTMESILIDKGIFTAEEYAGIFNKSVNKVIEALKTPVLNETIPDGVLKN